MILVLLQSALAFGEYFPNPGFTEQPFQEEGSSDFVFASNGVVTPGGALAVEAWGTFLLCFVVFALTHPKTTLFGKKEKKKKKKKKKFSAAWC